MDDIIYKGKSYPRLWMYRTGGGSRYCYNVWKINKIEDDAVNLQLICSTRYFYSFIGEYRYSTPFSLFLQEYNPLNLESYDYSRCI